MRSSNFCIFAAMFICLIAVASHAATPLPDTGQIKCYNDTAEITCPAAGQDYYGQDGSYSINTPSYTKLDENGNTLPTSATSWVMVKDNITGLIWEMKNNKDGVKDYTNPHDADNTYNWYDPNIATNGGDSGYDKNGTDTKDFIDALNAAKFGGFTDWRMPTLKELFAIGNHGISSPSVNQGYFQKTGTSYWSSTPTGYNSFVAWGISFSGPQNTTGDKATSSYALAVRGGQTEFFDWTINSDGTVTDNNTQLIWQQATIDLLK